MLVYSAQKTGASLLVDALGQHARTITLDLYPGKVRGLSSDRRRRAAALPTVELRSHGR